MQSAAHLMHGEVAGCVGCHEHRSQVPPSASEQAMPLAARRPVSEIVPFEGIPDRIDYRLDIQPIWDRHCVECHNPDKRDGGVLMTSDRGGGHRHTFGLMHSHLSLTATGQIVDSRGPHIRGDVPPRQMGSGASPLMNKLDGSHHDVRVSRRERQTVALWIDTMIPWSRYYGEQKAINYETSMKQATFSKQAQAVVESRCFVCHEQVPHRFVQINATRPERVLLHGEAATRNYLFYPEMNPTPEMDGLCHTLYARGTREQWENYRRLTFSRHEPQLRRGAGIVFNLDRPEKSLLLLAPLAKAAGGYATASIDEVKSGKVKTCPVVFASTDDPDYRTILDGMPRLPPVDYRPSTNLQKGTVARWGIDVPVPEGVELNAHTQLEAYWRRDLHLPCNAEGN
jgi:hypothetical protein